MVAAKIGEMAAVETNLDKAELTKATARTLGMFADDDLMTLQHAVEMFQALPNAELAIVPGTSHFLTQEKPDRNRDRARLPHPGPDADGGRHPARPQTGPANSSTEAAAQR